MFYQQYCTSITTTNTVNDANYCCKKSNSLTILDSSDFCAHKNDISTNPIV